MLDREVIKADFEHKYPIVLDLFGLDIDDAKVVYNNQMELLQQTNGKPPLNKNMPEIAGALKWSQQLRSRIEKPMSNFKHIEHPWVYSKKWHGHGIPTKILVLYGVCVGALTEWLTWVLHVNLK